MNFIIRFNSVKFEYKRLVITTSSLRNMRVYVHITGDLFHHGHISFFKKAKEFGECLIVGISSDDEVESYKRRPIMTLIERASVIKMCRLVDKTIVGAPACTTKFFIEKHNIDVVVATKAYSEDILNEFYSDPKGLGILKLVDYEKSISTTDIIKRCHQTFLNSNGSLGQL